MKKILLLFVLSLMISCDEQKTEPQREQVQRKTSFSDSLQVSVNKRVTLMPQAREIVSSWLAYVTAQDEVQRLSNRTGAEIMDISNNLMQIMESLKSTMPDTLRSPAVESRTNVLLTKAHVLHQLSNKKEKNPDEIFETAEDLVIEFENFKLQLNELFLKTPENFEMELDEAFEESLEPDSTGTIPLFREGDRI
ncbi:hypothetical protein [Salinimicrobium xinjiangense]|uniref:hypothetical protein n=1 Tax=Salinimicrobium xinjiangense TaxID=438596 RepID=UPI0003FC516B|nr:hypothetical protein [Salinimicrobium xinjiangense]